MNLVNDRSEVVVESVIASPEELTSTGCMILNSSSTKVFKIAYAILVEHSSLFATFVLAMEEDNSRQ